MKIALLGYGQMGKMVESVAKQNNIEIVKIYEKENPLTLSEKENLKDVDVLIDFSFPDAVIKNIENCVKLSKNIVVGTTGWGKQTDYVRKLVEENDTGLVYASNFSLGVNLFYKIVKYTGSLFKSFEIYDPYIEESHHKKKKDAPSGTAKVIHSLLENELKRDVPVTSVRAGYITGIHKVSFDSPVDEIQIMHKAKSRQGFAEGAVMAAKWITGRRGFHEFGELLESIIFKNNG